VLLGESSLQRFETLRWISAIVSLGKYKVNAGVQKEDWRA